MKDLYLTAREVYCNPNTSTEELEIERDIWIRETYTPTCD